MSTSYTQMRLNTGLTAAPKLCLILVRNHALFWRDLGAMRQRDILTRPNPRALLVSAIVFVIAPGLLALILR